MAVDTNPSIYHNSSIPPPWGVGIKGVGMRTRKLITQRLASATGHMEGIERMVLNDAYCPDVINQIWAVQAALDKISMMLLDSHLRTCVTTAVQGEDRQERVRAIAEVLALFDMSRKFRGSVINHPNSQKGDSDMNTKTFTVPNISCGGCTNTIERKVGQLAGVASVNAERATKQVTVSWEDPASWEQIQSALQEINYPPEGFIEIG